MVVINYSDILTYIYVMGDGLNSLMDKNLVFQKVLKVFLTQISMDDEFRPRGSKSHV